MMLRRLLLTPCTGPSSQRTAGRLLLSSPHHHNIRWATNTSYQSTTPIVPQATPVARNTLSPGSLYYLRLLRTLFNNKAVSDQELSEIRSAVEAATKQYGGPYQPVPRVEDIEISPATATTTTTNTSGDHNNSFTLRVYWPHKNATTSTTTTSSSSTPPPPVPVLLYCHGGGWTLGSVNTVDRLCRNLVDKAKIAIVSVDYRSAPNHKFPTQLDDVEAAYKWITQRPQDFDTSKILTGGDSAGGNLAAALLVRLSSFSPSMPRPIAQVLAYPNLDLTFSSPSYQQYGVGYGMDRDTLLYYRRLYLGEDKQDHNLESPDLSPLFTENPKEVFPPTLLLSAEADAAVDDAMRFGKRLEEAGVGVDHEVYKGVVHGFLNFHSVFPECEQAIVRMAGFIEKVLGGNTTTTTNNTESSPSGNAQGKVGGSSTTVPW